MRGAGVTLQTDKNDAVLVLRGPRFRVTSASMQLRQWRIPIGAVANPRVETHKAHWPAPNKAVAIIGFFCVFPFFLGVNAPVLIGLALIALGSLELRLAPTPFAVADIRGTPTRLLKCANEGEAKLVVLAIREAKRIAEGGEVVIDE